jgi:hypothetical protein
MTPRKRVFILGAGFSKAAGMPLATDLLDAICEKLEPGKSTDDDRDIEEWLDGLRQRVAWLSERDQQTDGFRLGIEEVFHYARFDIEGHRLKQQLARVGRGDGPGTSWNVAESIECWLQHLERALRDVIFEKDEKADLAPITRWARAIGDDDSVMTFNYDTLAERAIVKAGKKWKHAMPQEGGDGIAVCKLHGSIDWIVAHRGQSLSNLNILYDKPNENRRERDTGHVEDDYRLWRCQTREQLKDWVEGRDLQLVPARAMTKKIGIAGLGTYKPLHEIPGLAFSWTRGMRSLYEADLGVVVGFSMSDFDTMAQMQFAEVASKRREEGRPLSVIVIDPSGDEAMKVRFRRVFRSVEFLQCCQQDVDWNCLSRKTS